MLGARRIDPLTQFPTFGVDAPSPVSLAPTPLAPVAPTLAESPMPTLAATPHQSFFGQGGAGRGIAGTIGDFLLQLAHMQPVYAPAMQRKEQEQYAQQQHQQDRSEAQSDMDARFAQQMALERWKQQNKVDPLTEYMRLGGIDPNSPQGKALYAKRAGTIADPPRFVTLPNGQVVQMGGGGPTAQPLTDDDIDQMSGGQTQPASGNFLDNITAQAESGGNPSAVSPKGARGLMQVMPSTARNPGFSIRPSNGTPQDDIRVGREYRAAMQRRYGGDHAKMWAAYNAGPGRVDQALTAGEGWLARLPAETQAYVARNLRALRGG
jgi:hypothetical protein